MFPQQQQTHNMGDNFFDYPNDTVQDFEVSVTMLLNFWKNRLVLRTQEFHEAMLRREWNPREVYKTNSGEMSITAICESRKAGLLEARARMLTAEKMLENVKGGTLEGMWSDESITVPQDLVSPIQIKDKKSDQK